MTLYNRFAEEIGRILDSLEAEGAIPAGLSRRAITIEPPRDPSHGDLATNAAMVLAKPAGSNPRALAGLLAPKLEQVEGVTAVEIAGPGFLNLRLADEVWHEELATILGEGGDYGRSTAGNGHRVNVEYVSANPTGPMHMGHCRGAVVGDALASLLAFVGHPVTREYYINDAGAQVQTLARSAHLRYREALGEDIGEIPEGFYPGDYLKPVGIAFAAEFGTKYVDAPESEWLALFRTRAVAANVKLSAVPDTVAVSPLSPAAPSVQLPTVAIPDTPVVSVAPVTLPPPALTENTTMAFATGLLTASTTLTAGSIATGFPTAAL